MYAKDYSYNCSSYKAVEGFYVETGNWLGVAELLRAELEFFRKILQMFGRSARAWVFEQLDHLHLTLKGLEMKRKVFELQTTNYRILLDMQLKEMIYRKDSPSADTLTEEHERLESVFAILTREINEFKKKLFTVSESVFEGQS